MVVARAAEDVALEPMGMVTEVVAVEVVSCPADAVLLMDSEELMDAEDVFVYTPIDMLSERDIEARNAVELLVCVGVTVLEREDEEDEAEPEKVG